MNCKRCNNLIKETDIICPFCGENNIPAQVNIPVVPEPITPNVNVVNNVEAPQNNVVEPVNTFVNGPVTQETIIPNVNAVNNVEAPQNNIVEPANTFVNQPVTPEPIIPNVNTVNNVEAPQNNVVEPTNTFANGPVTAEPIIPNVNVVNNVEAPQNNIVEPVNTFINHPVTPEPIIPNVNAVNNVEAPQNNIVEPANTFVNGPVTPEPVMPNTYINNVPTNGNNIPNNNQENKKKSSFIIIVIILIAIIGVLIGFLVVRSFNNPKDSDIKDSIDNNNQQIVDSTDNKNTYEYKKFKFQIPNNYQVQIEADLLYLINEQDKILNIATIYEGFTLEDINIEIEEIKKSLINQGINVKSVSTKKYNNVDWIILDMTIKENGETINVFEAFCQLGNYHVADNMIINLGTRNNEYVFQELSEMYKNATYNGTSNFTPNDEKDFEQVDIINKLDPSLLN